MRRLPVRPVRALLLGGGVELVVGGGVGRGGLTGLLGGENAHQSVDRHASETHADPGYDGDSGKLFGVTYFSSRPSGLSGTNSRASS